MITAQPLLLLLNDHYKDRCDFIRYVCNGLPAYNKAHLLIKDPLHQALYRFFTDMGVLFAPKQESLEKWAASPWIRKKYPTLGDVPASELLSEYLKIKDTTNAILYVDGPYDFVFKGSQKRDWASIWRSDYPTFEMLQHTFSSSWADAPTGFLFHIANILARNCYNVEDLLSFIEADKNPESKPVKGERLSTWGEIADFFGVTIRTVQLWHTKYGMPVEHRKGIRTVIAWTGDLEDWDKKGLVRKRARKKSKMG